LQIHNTCKKNEQGLNGKIAIEAAFFLKLLEILPATIYNMFYKRILRLEA